MEDSTQDSCPQSSLTVEQYRQMSLLYRCYDWQICFWFGLTIFTSVLLMYSLDYSSLFKFSITGMMTSVLGIITVAICFIAWERLTSKQQFIESQSRIIEDGMNSHLLTDDESLKKHLREIAPDSLIHIFHGRRMRELIRVLLSAVFSVWLIIGLSGLYFFIRYVFRPASNGNLIL